MWEVDEMGRGGGEARWGERRREMRLGTCKMRCREKDGG